ncbi:MAG: hypothetical protein RR630_00775 [Coprobacillus sp.]
MNTHKKIYTMMLSAILIAVGTVIPLFMPKIIVGPMSFTLASHVAIMIAIFISPQVALAVSLGTTLGFFLAGFPFIVVLRALTHVIWAVAGAIYAKKNPSTFESPKKTLLFNLSIASIHAIAEMIIVIPFYFGTAIDAQTFFYMVFILVGVGTLVHSSVDFVISLVVWKALAKNNGIAKVSNVKNIYLLKDKEKVVA